MGIFSKKEEVGEMSLYLYPNHEMVIHNTFSHPDQWDMTVIAFSLFLGKTVYDLRDQRGTALWKSIFSLASSAFEVVREKDGIPIEEKLLQAQPLFKVVQSEQSIGNYLKETGKIVQKNNLYFCETSSTPSSYPDIEDTVMSGLESAFIYLFNTGNKQLKFCLPIVLVAQCNWYQENGFPSFSTFNQAAWHGIDFMNSALAAGSED